jgi:hypothetical protein
MLALFFVLVFLGSCLLCRRAPRPVLKPGRPPAPLPDFLESRHGHPYPFH